MALIRDQEINSKDKVRAVEGDGVDFRVGVQLRKAAAYNSFQQITAQSGVVEFDGRKSLQLDEVRTAGQGFGASLHEGELLETGQKEAAVAGAFSIDRGLEVAKEGRSDALRSGQAPAGFRCRAGFTYAYYAIASHI